MIKQKAKIVIASVLKPVDDVRNYEKIGNSLEEDGAFEIHMLGTSGNTNSNTITFHPWREFKRLSFSRLAVQFQFWNKLREIKPLILIVTTHELLISAVLYKWIHRTKIVYDVQEDYFKNLWYQHFYPPILRHLLAITIRTVEYLCSPFIHCFLLAEKTYAKDIGFISEKGVVIDNRSLEIPVLKKADFLKVVFTGTISHYSKALESIEFFLQLQAKLPDAKMTVIGYCPKRTYKAHLEELFNEKVTLKLSEKPVPHSEILKEISRSNLAIIGYQPDPVNENKIPTKLFEYAIANVPFIVQKNTLWAMQGERLGHAIGVDFLNPNFDEIAEKIHVKRNPNPNNTDCLWFHNEIILVSSIKSIINSTAFS